MGFESGLGFPDSPESRPVSRFGTFAGIIAVCAGLGILWNTDHTGLAGLTVVAGMIVTRISMGPIPN